jgi:hypothetical protein
MGTLAFPLLLTMQSNNTVVVSVSMELFDYGYLVMTRVLHSNDGLWSNTSQYFPTPSINQISHPVFSSTISGRKVRTAVYYCSLRQKHEKLQWISRCYTCTCVHMHSENCTSSAKFDLHKNVQTVRLMDVMYPVIRELHL